MAIQRITLSRPTDMRGLEDYFPKELWDGVQEMIRRSTVNYETLRADLRAQVVTDPSLLPTENTGESADATTVLVTDSDLDGADKETMMWEG